MSTYSTLGGHRSMVFDDQRNGYYARAIKKAVNGDSVVLDLGAGLGLHGFIAAYAGAKKVYLVEPASVLEIARQLVSSNNLDERIECVSGCIEEIQLPEKADIIISVFTGNFLLSEDLLPSLFFARDKYLAPGGKLIPDRAAMEVVPVCAADYYAKHIDCWNGTSQDVPLKPVRNYAANTLIYDVPKKRKTEFLARPTTLLEMNFMTATEAACKSRIEVEVTRDGLCHGWLGWFQIRLGDQWLSTSPKDKKTHWSQVFLPLTEPVSVKKGDILHFELDRAEYGEWTWSMECGGRKQRQSTFLSEPVSPARLQKKSDSHKPRISEKGEAAMEVLSRFKGSQSTAEIVGFIMSEYKALFPTQKLADNFVKALVDQHCF
jgi:hypothetical protein